MSTHHTHTPVIAPNVREILEGSLEFDGTVSEASNPEGLNLDTDGLFVAIRAVLDNTATDEQIRRVLRHLREDEFDYASNDADEGALALQTALIARTPNYEYTIDDLRTLARAHVGYERDMVNGVRTGQLTSERMADGALHLAGGNYAVAYLILERFIKDEM